MHALASKAVNKDRELASRSKFYYEVEENESCVQKFKKYIRTFVTFFFTQVTFFIDKKKEILKLRTEMI